MATPDVAVFPAPHGAGLIEAEVNTRLDNLAVGRFRLLTEPASLKPDRRADRFPSPSGFRLLTEPASLKRVQGAQRLVKGLVRVSGSSRSRPH